jgi:sugar phosphate isomerase/epimerase
MGREADMKAAVTHLTNENLRVSVVNTSLLKFPWPGGDTPGDQARWNQRMDDFQKALRCAQIMGADKLRIFAGTRTANPASMFPRIADAIGEMAAEAEKQKVSLVLENDAETNVATCAELAEAMKLIPSKWVGINWKPAADGYPLLPKKRILNVHVPAATLVVGKPEFLNWKTILMALEKDGYAGRITLEIGPQGDKGIDATRDAFDNLVHVVREVS